MEHLWRTLEMITTSGRAGITMNQEKFQFAQWRHQGVATVAEATPIISLKFEHVNIIIESHLIQVYFTSNSIFNNLKFSDDVAQTSVEKKSSAAAGVTHFLHPSS